MLHKQTLPPACLHNAVATSHNLFKAVFPLVLLWLTTYCDLWRLFAYHDLLHILLFLRFAGVFTECVKRNKLYIFWLIWLNVTQNEIWPGLWLIAKYDLLIATYCAPNRRSMRLFTSKTFHLLLRPITILDQTPFWWSSWSQRHFHWVWSQSQPGGSDPHRWWLINTVITW